MPMYVNASLSSQVMLGDGIHLLQGYSIKEENYKSFVSDYLCRLDDVQKNSFAQIDQLIKNSLDGFDLQVLVLKTSDTEVSPASIDGLVIFNQDSSAVRLPNGNYAVKIVIHHISAINVE